jgi:hypothetical protein
MIQFRDIVSSNGKLSVRVYSEVENPGFVAISSGKDFFRHVYGEYSDLLKLDLDKYIKCFGSACVFEVEKDQDLVDKLFSSSHYFNMYVKEMLLNSLLDQDENKHTTDVETKGIELNIIVPEEMEILADGIQNSASKIEKLVDSDLKE